MLCCGVSFDWCVRIVGIVFVFFFFQAEDGIRDLVRSRGLGDVYKRQYIIPCIKSAVAIVVMVCFGF